MKKGFTHKSMVLAATTLLIALAFAAGCGESGSGKPPGEVAQEAVRAAFEMDCARMYDLTAESAFEGADREESIKQCEEATAGSKELLESMNAELVKVETRDEQIDGDKATVTAVITIKVQDEQADQEQSFELVKEDGEWKIMDAPQL